MIFDAQDDPHGMSAGLPDMPDFHDSGSEMTDTPQSVRMDDSVHDSTTRSAPKRSADALDSTQPPTKQVKDAQQSQQQQPQQQQQQQQQQPKQKSTRGARACTNCHRLKMKCEVSKNGGPCLRCARSGHECIFLESNRGRKSDKRRKTAAMQQGVKKVEQIVESVLQTMNDPKQAASKDSNASFGMPMNAVNMINLVNGGPVGSTNSAISNVAAHMGLSPNLVDMLVSRIRKLVTSPNGAAGDMNSVHAISEQTVKFMQQMGMLDETVLNRLLDASEDGFLKRLLHTAIAGLHPPSPSPSTSASNAPSQNMSNQGGTASGAAAESMDTMNMPHLPDNTLNPLGLFAEASLENWHRQQSEQRQTGQSPTSSTSMPRDGSTSSSNADTEGPGARGAAGRQSTQFGVANDTYFHPSSMAPRASENGSESPPELLTEGIISSEEALELFRIFFHHCSLHMFLLDPEWHTPTLVCSRSPFLFTCVCAVASKFYTRRRDLYVQCQRRAIKGAFDAMSKGFKSPDIVQGFLLLTLYNQPVERYEEDRTWLFAGVAIRMAQDLNLHRKCVMSPEAMDDEATMRDVLNRERTWYICFCVDRTLSAQMGKPYSIREDFLIRHASEWCMQKFSRPWDLGICALVDLLRVQTRQLDFLYSSTVTPSGLNVDLDYPSILPSFNEQLTETMQFWYRLGLDSVTRTLHSTPPLGGAAAAAAASKPPASQTQSGGEGAREAHGGTGHANATEPSSAEYLAKQKAMVSAMLPTLNRIVMNLDNAGTADTLRVSALLALHEAGPPAEDADLLTRSIYYIARQAPLRYNYAVLVLNSFGLQYALERPSDGASADKPQYLVRCVHAAKEIIATVKCGMREILRYAPDPTFVAVAYACVFLLKLIRPMFRRYINEDEVIALVSYTIEVLEEAAVDPSHTPALYASFLRMLVQSRLDQRARENGERGEEGSAVKPGEDPLRPHHSHAAHAARSSSAHVDPHVVRNDPPLASPRAPNMTVNPLQVNPIAAELAAREKGSSVPQGTTSAAAVAAAAAASAGHPHPESALSNASSQSASETPPHSDPASLHAHGPHHMHDPHMELDDPTLGTPLAMPLLAATNPSDLHGKMPDTHGLAQEPFPDLHGWDALQYAKAQGVEVNRVLDNSFWTSLLPPGYGSGGVGQGAQTFEFNRDLDLFKTSSQWGVRPSLTPGATRPSSPTIPHMPF